MNFCISCLTQGGFEWLGVDGGLALAFDRNLNLGRFADAVVSDASLSSSFSSAFCFSQKLLNLFVFIFNE